jgi:glycosyltransferase involved in cell wall biosynthesis
VVADNRHCCSAGNGGIQKILFLTAGRFSDYIKGGDLAYRAFSYLYHSNPNVFLLVISNSRRFSSILRDVPENAYKIVDWLPRPKFLETLAAADVVVVPSRYESFGLVAVEAMMLGKPVIANNVGGLQEIIHHGRTGLLNDLREGSFGLYHAMKKSAESETLRKEIGEAAQKYAQREFDLGRVAELVQKSLDSAVMRNRSLAAACPYY